MTAITSRNSADLCGKWLILTLCFCKWHKGKRIGDIRGWWDVLKLVVYKVCRKSQNTGDIQTYLTKDSKNWVNKNKIKKIESIMQPHLLYLWCESKASCEGKLPTYNNERKNRGENYRQKFTGRKETWWDTHDVDVIFLQVNLELEFFQISLIVMMIVFHLYPYHLFHSHPSCKAKLVLQTQAPMHQGVKTNRWFIHWGSLKVHYRLKPMLLFA